MADGELGNLRRAPRLLEEQIARQARYRTEGMVGGAFDAVRPVDLVDDAGFLGDNSGDDGGGGAPDWYKESLSVTSAIASTWTLTNVPVDTSAVIALNGIVLDEGVDYTIAENVVTWLNPADLVLGIGSDTWRVDATYPYFATASAPDPAPSYTASSPGIATPITLPQTVVAGDVCILAVGGDSTGVSGAFATWTQIYNGSSFSNTGANIDVWLGTGVGTGSTITVTAGDPSFTTAPACVVYHDINGTVAVRNVTNATTTSSLSLGAANVTAVVDDIVICAVNALKGAFNDYYPTGAHTDTGIGGMLDITQVENVSGGQSGVCLVAGYATATAVGSVFTLAVGPGFGAEAVNIALSVT